MGCMEASRVKVCLSGSKKVGRVRVTGLFIVGRLVGPRSLFYGLLTVFGVRGTLVKSRSI